MPISEGVTYTFWTFGGHVPGKFIPRAPGRHRGVPPAQHARQQDAAQHRPARRHRPRRRRGLQLHRARPRVALHLQALNAGLFVYHCATAPVGMHIANGMYGLILVEPPGGLPPVDHEYYVMQGDFYTTGKYRERPPALRHGQGDRGTPDLRAVQRPRRRADRRQRAEGEHRPDRAPVRRQRRPEPGVELPRDRRDLRQGLVRGWHPLPGERADHADPRPVARRSWTSTSKCPAATCWSTTRSSAPSTRALAILKADGPERKDIYSGKEVDAMYLGDRAQPTCRRSPGRHRARLRHADPGRPGQGRAGAVRGTCSTCHQANGEAWPGCSRRWPSRGVLRTTPSASSRSCCTASTARSPSTAGITTPPCRR